MDVRIVFRAQILSLQRDKLEKGGMQKLFGIGWRAMRRGGDGGVTIPAAQATSI
jgi:hypothetical protein